MRHRLCLTIQCRSLKIYQPQHSAGHGDKDQCDEKQPRQQACAPFLAKDINSPCLAEPFECFRMWTPLRTRTGLVRNAEVRWKGRACSCNAARSICRLVRPDFDRRSRKWLLAFGFEQVV